MVYGVKHGESYGPTCTPIQLHLTPPPFGSTAAFRKTELIRSWPSSAWKFPKSYGSRSEKSREIRRVFDPSTHTLRVLSRYIFIFRLILRYLTAKWKRYLHSLLPQNLTVSELSHMCCWCLLAQFQVLLHCHVVLIYTIIWAVHVILHSLPTCINVFFLILTKWVQTWVSHIICNLVGGLNSSEKY